MNTLLQDLRYALRQLRKSPGFTAVAVLTLALGIGANTAIYSLLDQALFRRLPVESPGQLTLLRYEGRNDGASYTRHDGQIYFSYPMYRNLRDRNSVFSGLIATAWAQVGIQWHNQPELANAELVSANYFDVLGLHPALGRLLVPSDDAAQQASPVVVLSFDYWKRRFGLDPGVLNQALSVNGHPFVIVGVAPPNFRSVVVGDTPSIFVPMMTKAQVTPGWNDLDQPRSSWLNIFGRLKPDLTREQAQAGVAPLWHAIRADEFTQMSGSQRFRDAFVTNSHLYLLDGSRGVAMHGSLPTTLLVVMGLSGLIALIVCTNVGSLLLVRMASRTREISMRYALGAKRVQILRQLLTEGIVLGIAGGAAGMAVAPQFVSLVIAAISGSRPEDFGLSPHLDYRVWLFNFLVALAASLLFSLAPALQFWKPDVTAALKLQTVVAVGALRLRRFAVVAQISLSLLLLAGAGLFIRTLHNLRTQDVGFATDHLLTFEVDPRLAGYEPAQAALLHQRVLERLRALPGVRFAAATNDPELANNSWSGNITIDTYHPAENENMNVELAKVTPDYFSALGISLIAGRPISEQDGMGAAKVAVVNEKFARRFFGEPQAAIGHLFCQGDGNVKPDIQIVGVVKDVKHTSLREHIDPSAFRSLLQEDGRDSNHGQLTFYLRTWQAPESAQSAVRQALHSLDSNLVLNDFRTMQEQISENLGEERLVAHLAAAFGALAALMAAIGIYGVLAYSTARRTQEIGIRMALGATRSSVVRTVLRELLWLASVGTATGLALSFGFAHVVRNQLFGVSNADPLTLVVVSFVIAVIAFGAAVIPARRASKVDPNVALRYE